MPSTQGQSGATAGELALHAHRYLLRAGLSIANVFAWIFVFQFFYLISNNVARSLIGVVLLYGLSQGVTIVLTPLSAMHLRRGSKHALIWGTLVAAFAYVMLGGFLGGFFSTDQPLWGAAAFAVLIGVYRAVYWVPYHLVAAAASSTGSERQNRRLIYEVIIALLPLFAGLTLMEVPFAPLRLLFGAAALIALSILPALLLPDKREHYSWSYRYTFQQLLRPKHSALVLTAFFDGLQGAALFLIWPLSVFLILEWSYATVGLVFSLTLLLVILARGIYARFLSHYKMERSSVIAVFAISGWVARLAAGTPIGIIVADTYSYASQPLRGTMADPFTFEQSTDRGAFVDEYTVLKEISLSVGRIAMCMLVGFLALATPIPVALAAALVLAAFASGISVALARVTPASVH